MQKIITKHRGRYRVSFAHWSKTQRTLLGLFMACALMFMGWIVYRDQPMPVWFEKYIWNNVVYFFLALVLIRWVFVLGKEFKKKG